jgi:prophage tail gpP-like protein
MTTPVLAWSGPVSDEPAPLIELYIRGQIFRQVVSIEIDRAIEETTGAFSAQIRDAARARASWHEADGFASPSPHPGQIKIFDPVQIVVDGELYLVGYVDEVSGEIADGEPVISISGRDETADLVDCSAAPEGPAEYRNLTVKQFAERLCKPHKIKVTVEGDVGAPFEVLSRHVGEPVMAAIERYARQRSLIAMSDGIGGLTLVQTGSTTGGTVAFPSDLVISTSYSISGKERASDLYVKGSKRQGAGKRRDKKGRLDATASPLTSPPPPIDIDAETETERAGASSVGRARDPEVTRYRPMVIQSATETGDEDAQAQAERQMRTMRGRGENYTATMWGVRHPDTQEIWRPNILHPIEDSFWGIKRTLVAARVKLSYAEGTAGQATVTFKSPETFDGKPAGGRRRDRKGGKKKGKGGKLDSSAAPL